MGRHGARSCSAAELATCAENIRASACAARTYSRKVGDVSETNMTLKQMIIFHIDQTESDRGSSLLFKQVIFARSFIRFA
jgi:hypothetical protein